MEENCALSWPSIYSEALSIEASYRTISGTRLGWLLTLKLLAVVAFIQVSRDCVHDQSPKSRGSQDVYKKRNVLALGQNALRLQIRHQLSSQQFNPLQVFESQSANMISEIFWAALVLGPTVQGAAIPAGRDNVSRVVFQREYSRLPFCFYTSTNK